MTFDLRDHVGAAAIITPLAVEEVMTESGKRPAVRADVVVLLAEPEEHKSSLIFQALVVKQLTPLIGQPVVVALRAQTRADGGSSLILAAAPAQAVEVAEKYLATV